MRSIRQSRQCIARFWTASGSFSETNGARLSEQLTSTLPLHQSPSPQHHPSLFFSVRSFAKQKHNKKDKTAHQNNAAASQQDQHQDNHHPQQCHNNTSSTIDEFNITTYTNQMQKIIDHLHAELKAIRTGRANPAMLDFLRIHIHGDHLPLKALGAVTARDPQTLGISLFDPTTVDIVCKAIIESPLGLNPKIAGQDVLVPIPEATAETRQAMAKMCKLEGEGARVHVRQIRRNAMEGAKKKEGGGGGGGGGGEDDVKRRELEVQKLTDEFIRRVDGIVMAKEKELQH